jgi:hypothetical protein
MYIAVLVEQARKTFLTKRFKNTANDKRIKICVPKRGQRFILYK